MIQLLHLLFVQCKSFILREIPLEVANTNHILTNSSLGYPQVKFVVLPGVVGNVQDDSTVVQN